MSQNECAFCKTLNADTPLALFANTWEHKGRYYCETHYMLKTGKLPQKGIAIKC